MVPSGNTPSTGAERAVARWWSIPERSPWVTAIHAAHSASRPLVLSAWGGNMAIHRSMDAVQPITMVGNSCR